MFTQRTVLGRRVRIDDWRSFHRDRLLAVLYSMRDSQAEEPELTFDQIASVTGLPRKDVPSLVTGMTRDKPKVARLTTNATVALTERGIRWVEESPTAP